MTRFSDDIRDDRPIRMIPVARHERPRRSLCENCFILLRQFDFVRFRPNEELPEYGKMDETNAKFRVDGNRVVFRLILMCRVYRICILNSDVFLGLFECVI